MFWRNQTLTELLLANWFLCHSCMAMWERTHTRTRARAHRSPFQENIIRLLASATGIQLPLKLICYIISYHMRFFSLSFLLSPHIRSLFSAGFHLFFHSAIVFACIFMSVCWVFRFLFGLSSFDMPRKHRTFELLVAYVSQAHEHTHTHARAHKEDILILKLKFTSSCFIFR